MALSNQLCQCKTFSTFQTESRRCPYCHGFHAWTLPHPSSMSFRQAYRDLEYLTLLQEMEAEASLPLVNGEAKDGSEKKQNNGSVSNEADEDEQVGEGDEQVGEGDSNVNKDSDDGVMVMGRYDTLPWMRKEIRELFDKRLFDDTLQQDLKIFKEHKKCFVMHMELLRHKVEGQKNIYHHLA